MATIDLMLIFAIQTEQSEAFENSVVEKVFLFSLSFQWFLTRLNLNHKDNERKISMSPESLSSTDTKFSSLTETVKMTTTKKMSIFVLQPNGSHSQWQGEKLNNVYQVS